MSTDTELTFIRCPSCKSLMPAVASRCRMCGHVVESLPGVPAGDPQDKIEKKSRVRQRTVTVPEDFLEDMKEQLDAADLDLIDSSDEENKADVDSNIENESDEFDEPDEEILSNSLENNNSSITGVPSVTVPGGESRKRRRRRKKRKHHRGEQSDQGDPVNLVPGEPQLQRLVSGAHDSKSPENFSSSHGTVQSATMRGPDTLSGVGMSQKPRQVIASPKEREDYTLKSQGEPGGKQNEHWQRGGSSMEPHSQSERKAANNYSQVSSSHPDRGQEHADEGVLLGWLVDYTTNAKGVARELRTGRFFIGAEQLRATDLVIAHSSLSTPHCLVKGSHANGLEIQDLMSERGTFVKKRGEQNWQKIEHAVVAHGDRIRLGSYEVVVSLAP